MQDNFRICIIAPPGYRHAGAFLEVAFLLKSTLVSIGYECDIMLNDLSTERVNIILGWHLMKYVPILQKFRYIPYQLEQLSEREGIYSDSNKGVLEHAHSIWDYSNENIDFLTRHGCTAKLLPVGYHPALEMIKPAAVRDIDVLFYGSQGGRRKHVLDILRADSTMNVSLLFGSYSQDRDSHISRALCILNIHYYSMAIFEAVRVSYLLNNRCCVISEESSVNPYPMVNLISVSRDSIPDVCRYYNLHPEEAIARGETNYREFVAQYPMTELMRAVL